MKQNLQPTAEPTPAEILALYPSHDETIGGLLSSRASVAQNRLLLMFDQRCWTYGQFDRASLLLARRLAGHGINHGDCVAIAAANSDIFLLVFVAVARLGALFIPLNPGQTDGELSYMLHHCRPKAVLAPEEERGRLDKLLGDAVPPPIMLSLEIIGAGAGSSDDVLAQFEAAEAGANVTLPLVKSSDPAVVIYTSGTTGYPKGVVHSQRNYVLAAEAFVERMHLQPTDRLLTVLPFFHINALFYSWGGALAAGAALVTTAKFSASRLWQLAASTGATQFNILAAVGNILAKRPRDEFDPAHRIRRIYGGPISAEMFRVFQQEFHVPTLIEGYGMSEIPGACNNPFDGPIKIGSIGKPARHPRFGSFVECKVVDEEGRVLPPGEIGELMVKTSIMTLGYLNDPEQTAAAIEDGWFRTGDYVTHDADGYYFFIARKRDIIRRRGENISGAELDRVLSEHPNILEAATIGVDAELGDEEIMAVLVAKSQPAPAPEELVAWCADRLAAMKIPRFFVFTDALPHNSSHRVTKFRLKEDASLRRRAWDREAQA